MIILHISIPELLILIIQKMSLGHNGDDEITIVLSRQVLASVMLERVPVTQGPVSVIRESVAMALTQALVYVTLETMSMTQVHLVCDSWTSLSLTLKSACL